MPPCTSPAGTGDRLDLAAAGHEIRLTPWKALKVTVGVSTRLQSTAVPVAHERQSCSGRAPAGQQWKLVTLWSVGRGLVRVAAWAPASAIGDTQAMTGTQPNTLYHRSLGW